MTGPDVAILLALGVCVVLALRTMRKRGGCCGDCSKCHRACKSE